MVKLRILVGGSRMNAKEVFLGTEGWNANVD
jgi:hypothetical protein